MDREVVFLDRLTADMRAASGNALSRAHLVRALIDALAESDIDLSDIRSEGELRIRLAERLAQPRS